MRNGTSGTRHELSYKDPLTVTEPRERAAAAADVAKVLHSQLTLLVDALGASGACRSDDNANSSTETEIDHQLAEAVDSCCEELLVMQAGGTQRPSFLSPSVLRDKATPDRGVRFRAVFHHATRHDAETVSQVNEMTEAGVEVRTFDEVITRLIVVDRRIAFVTAATDNAAVVKITQPAVIACLARLFEYVWARADPFLPHTVQNVTTPVRDLVVNLLIEGATGSAIAKRLGISERTLAKYIARLKEEHRAKSSFQLGYRLAAGLRPGVRVASRHRD